MSSFLFRKPKLGAACSIGALCLALSLIGCSDKRVPQISAGAAHSLALDKEGKLYATGDNEYGQLGLNDKTDRDTFTLVPIGGKK
ncbi:MAG: hypothetical protein LBC09_02490 [Helicobacteraceae bacterium]|jgi:alpha-tubulin suppressor-like RCC1 family protein|nr:hypothetical protein [Helicobacteraceae bacterium]